MDRLRFKVLVGRSHELTQSCLTPKQASKQQLVYPKEDKWAQH